MEHNLVLFSLNAHRFIVYGQNAPPLKISPDRFGVRVDLAIAINALLERDDLGGRVSRASPRAACLALSSYS